MGNYLLESLCSVLWGVYPRVGSLDHVVVVCLIFQGATLPLSTAAAAFATPASGA